MKDSEEPQNHLSPRKWWWSCLCLIILLLVAQFYVFRWKVIYDLCWQTHLEDHVWWVDQPAKHLVMGSSSAMNSTIPNLIHQQNNLGPNHTLNLGMNGVTPIVMLVNLKRYLERFPPPERVDLSITPAMITESYHAAKNYEKIFLTWEQWRKWKHKENLTLANSYFFPSMLFWNCLEIEKNYLFRQYHFTIAEMRSERGFRPIYEHPYTFVMKHNDYPVTNKDFGWSRPQLEALKEIHHLLDSLDVKIYHLLTPLHPKAYEIYLKQGQSLEELEHLLKEYLKPRAILGNFNPQPYGLTHDHFFNADHITISGARLFTSHVYGDIQAHSKLPVQHIDFLP